MLGELARALRAHGASGLALTNLKLCRQFYRNYSALLVEGTAAWQQLGLPLPQQAAFPGLTPALLLKRLSFSNFSNCSSSMRRCNALSMKCRRFHIYQTASLLTGSVQFAFTSIFSGSFRLNRRVAEFVSE
jgi:hypothetical protein